MNRLEMIGCLQRCKGSPTPPVTGTPAQVWVPLSCPSVFIFAFYAAFRSWSLAESEYFFVTADIGGGFCVFGSVMKRGSSGGTGDLSRTQYLHYRRRVFQHAAAVAVSISSRLAVDFLLNVRAQVSATACLLDDHHQRLGQAARPPRLLFSQYPRTQAVGRRRHRLLGSVSHGVVALDGSCESDGLASRLRHA